MGWRFWVDRGGTFTDVIATSPGGTVQTLKVLSVDPARYADAAVYAIRTILNLPPNTPFPTDQVDEIKVGTTIATNALLERTGEPTVLVTTAGLGDVLRIGAQHRPKLFDLNIKLPAQLYSAVIEARERMSAHGQVLCALDEDDIRAKLHTAAATGFHSVAIALMHADRYPAHERAIAAIARETGFRQVSVSHRVNPVMKLVGRGHTTVADAYLSPVVQAYAGQLAHQFGATALSFMQSNGGLAPADRFMGKDAVLSGPAGGIVGARETALAAGFDRIISFDMGGTSTDVAHIAGPPELAYDTTVAGVPLRTPMMKIHTVAAGGGSICSFDGLRLKVGPESAGSEPGPACYRKGGPLTVTDCNVALGRITAADFPHVFGPDANAPIDERIVGQKLDVIRQDLVQATGRNPTREELAESFVALAVDNMSRAIKRISTEQGHDLRGYALACFGGAGGQHACLVAEALEMNTVIIHPMAGVLSAFGIGLARARITHIQTVECPLSADQWQTITAALETVRANAIRELQANSSVQKAASRAHLHVKAPGSDTALSIPIGPLEQVLQAFTTAHRARFGFAPGAGQPFCESVEIEAFDATPSVLPVFRPPSVGTPCAPQRQAIIFSRSKSVAGPVFKRGDIPLGSAIPGPALIVEQNATTVIESGWSATVADDGHVVLRRNAETSIQRTITTERDPARIEIFNNLFMSIAERMGATLQSTARSVNIKERLDFSCAIFNAAGALVANAPHMPVHLGSMGDSVRAVREKHSASFQPGDAYVLNAPYDGGTHLPDITVVTPVFLDGESTPQFFAASRGHHADIGGSTPGSMPSNSTTIAEEGIVLDNMLIVRNDQFRETEIRQILGASPWPARNPDANVADIKAQVAATVLGGAELVSACNRFGADVVTAYMGHVLDHAEAAVRRAIGRLSSGSFVCPMDDGGQIAVRVTINHQTGDAVVDFSNTSAQRPTNFNAPRSICRAAVMYVFRTLIDEDVPLNDGCMRPIRLMIPKGSMLDPQSPAAVVAGNVETSQIICDALYGALGVLAASQGTMNNLTFGNARHQYYETICGGAGAGPDFDGASAVQTHMTNSRLTDPEVLEWRFPVVVEKFALRAGSGGTGRHRGGDGVVRTLRFAEPVTAAILSGRRTTQPFGQAGGTNGQPGATILHRVNGQMVELGPTATVELQPGDSISILTPGGGGFGNVEPDHHLAAPLAPERSH
jgi:5-oxoprolinase (ATP-hydrolysing)